MGRKQDQPFATVLIDRFSSLPNVLHAEAAVTVAMPIERDLCWLFWLDADQRRFTVEQDDALF